MQRNAGPPPRMYPEMSTGQTATVFGALLFVMVGVPAWALADFALPAVVLAALTAFAYAGSRY